MNIRLVLFVALAPSIFWLGGCTHTAFKQYTGSQQNWPRAAGAYVDTGYDVPVFYGPPPRPYDVIGYLDAEAWPATDRKVLAAAARRAKTLDADAIVLVDIWSHYTGIVSTVGTTYASSYAINYFAPPLVTGRALPILDDYASAILIRFRDHDAKGMK